MRKVSKLQLILSWIAVIGMAVSFLADASAIVVNTDYNILTNSVSSLAWGPMGWIQVLSFYCFGISVAACAYGLYLSLKHDLRPSIGVVCLMVVSISFLFIGTFNAVPEGAPMTLSGYIHDISSFFSAIFFIAGSFVIAPSLKDDHETLFHYTLATGMLSLILLGGDRLPTDWPWIGLRERVEGINAAIWIVVMSIAVVRKDRTL